MERIMINLEEDFHRRYFKKDIVTLEEILEKIEELDDEIDYLKEAYQNLENDVRDNYRPIPVMEQVGMSERDFI
jgi:archaellum component FlaC